MSRPLPTARASARRARGHGGPSSASAAAPPERAGGAERRWRDAQAGVPSTRRPRAQLAFKDSMVRGILQFTPGIAFRYVLHRWESRDIRCRESSGINFGRPRGHPARGRPALPSLCVPWRHVAPGFVRAPRRPLPTREGGERDAGGGPAGRAGARPAGVRSRVRGRPWSGIDNDPSAGSPTETLLRLLLPLNDKVQWTSRDVASGEPPASPRSEHFTGPFNR